MNFKTVNYKINRHLSRLQHKQVVFDEGAHYQILF